MQKAIFASFYFRDFMFTREIRENKNLAKISTYTVFHCPLINSGNMEQ